MSNYEEFGGMVTYAFGLKHRKFYTGKQIKDIITRCLSDETIVGYQRKNLWILLTSTFIQNIHWQIIRYIHYLGIEMI